MKIKIIIYALKSYVKLQSDKGLLVALILNCDDYRNIPDLDGARLVSAELCV